MADAVSTTTLFSGSHRKILSFTNVSDGTGESAVSKVSISALTGTPTAVRIMRIWYSCNGIAVRVLFDHTTDDTVLVLSGAGYMDFYPMGGLPDPASAGGTGDILFTTIGQILNDSYSIVMEINW